MSLVETSETGCLNELLSMMCRENTVRELRAGPEDTKRKKERENQIYFRSFGVDCWRFIV